MSDRIPTTDEVRNAAMNSGNWEEQILPSEFDRWLAEVKAQAWEEGWGNGNVYGMNRSGGRKENFDNPYRQGKDNE